MGYDWSKEAEGEGTAGKLPNGIHHVTGVKTVHGAGPKGPWVMVVAEDAAGMETTAIFTLTEKAAWTLARWISRCNPDNLKAMHSEGIEPTDFVNPDLAAQYLIGESTWVRIEDGNPPYKNVTPLKEEEVPEALRGVVKAPAPPKDDDLNLADIPF